MKGKMGLYKVLKRIMRTVFSRLVVTALLIVLQIVWIAVLFLYLTDYARWITVLFAAISVVMCAVLIRQDSTAPEFKISWMVLFMLMPVQGGLLYLLWGDRRPAFRLRKKLEAAAKKIYPLRPADPDAQRVLEAENPRAAATAAYLRDYGPYPLYDNTAVTYYPSGRALFDDLLPEMEKAEHFLFVEFFIISRGRLWDRVHDILRRKAAEGVDVRLIYDDVGCTTAQPGLPMNEWKLLEAEGIKAVPFNPLVPMLNLVMNHRDHRKIVAIDGRVAYTGGANIADEYVGEIERFGVWKDTGVRLEGDAAWSFTTMFLEFWAANRPHSSEKNLYRPARTPLPHSGLVQPFADSPVDAETIAKNTCLELISQAERELLITTPYLILDNDTITALRMAAKRGVDVRIYTPGIPDKKMVYQLTRSYFPVLLQAGVKIYSYTPGFLHAKNWLCDGKIGAVGSINLDYRSLYLHFECSALLYGCDALAAMRADMKEIEASSRAVTLKDCRTGFFGTLYSALLRLLAPLC